MMTWKMGPERLQNFCAAAPGNPYSEVTKLIGGNSNPLCYSESYYKSIAYMVEQSLSFSGFSFIYLTFRFINDHH